MTSQASGNTLQRDWSEFAENVRARLEIGAREYGDASFERPPEELVSELQQEVMDIAGWGFVLWVRLQRLKANMESVSSSAQ